MKSSNFKTAGRQLALAAMAAVLFSAGADAQETGVDPADTRILQGMTDYLGSLQQFSVHT